MGKKKNVLEVECDLGTVLKRTCHIMYTIRGGQRFQFTCTGHYFNFSTVFSFDWTEVTLLLSPFPCGKYLHKI